MSGSNISIASHLPSNSAEAWDTGIGGRCTQQMVNVIFQNGRDSAFRLVVPMNMNGKKVRLAVYRNALAAYMSTVWPACKQMDSLRIAMAGLLAGTRTLPYNVNVFAIQQPVDYKLLSWSNVYLQQSPANRNYFLTEVLNDYTEDGGFFTLNGNYEGDEYVIEALQRYHLLAQRKHGRTVVVRVDCNSGTGHATATEGIDTLMEKVAVMVYSIMTQGEHYTQLVIPAVLHGERVRIQVLKTSYDKYMIASNPLYKNRDSLMKELGAVLSHRKEWILNDSTAADIDFLTTRVQILRKKNPYPGPGEISTEDFIKKYAAFYDDRPNGWPVACTYTSELAEAFFRHHCLLVYGDGHCAIVWAKYEMNRKKTL